MKPLVNRTNRYRMLVLSIAAVLLGVGMVSSGFATPAAGHHAASFASPATHRTPNNFASTRSICLTPKPVSGSCTVSIPTTEMIQNHTLSQGMDWTISPPLACDFLECGGSFTVTDNATSNITVDTSPYWGDNTLVLDATGASLGNHTLSVSFSGQDNSGFIYYDCNDLSMYVTSGQSREAAGS